MVRQLHFLNLNTVGGVEELFAHFVKLVPKGMLELVITGRRPHPFFQDALAESKVPIHLERYLFGVKLPTWLKRWQRGRFIGSDTGTAVFWNRIEPYQEIIPLLDRNWNLIYYEHGASWMQDQRAPFFDHVQRALANSYAAKRLLELKWHLSCPIQVIHNPLRPDIIPACRPKERKKGTPLRIGYIGRLIPLKGVSLLVHALDTLRRGGVDATLSIAGDGSERAHIADEADRLKCTPFVTFLGCQRDVGAFYDSIDLLVVPSIREPLGMVAQEGALRGCPIVATRVDGLAEVVAHRRSGLSLSPTEDVGRYPEFGGTLKMLPDLVYDPEGDCLAPPRFVHPQKIAEAIFEIVEDSDRYREMSMRAIEHASKRPRFSEYARALRAQLALEEG